jgi:hypothetical protein
MANGHFVEFGPIKDAGVGVNMHVRLMVHFPWEDNSIIGKSNECILSFYAHIKNPRHVGVVKRLIEEDWVFVLYGAVEVARRYMQN